MSLTSSHRFASTLLGLRQEDDLGIALLDSTLRQSKCRQDTGKTGTDTPRRLPRSPLYIMRKLVGFCLVVSEDLSMLRRWLFGWTLLQLRGVGVSHKHKNDCHLRQHLLGQDVLGTGYRRPAEVKS